jgi:ectoine hydroxylase-related dioxygenase (phytanoyl-CoA dioxygenase family)
MIISKFYEDDIREFLEFTGIDFSKGWTFKVTCWYGMMTNSTSQFPHDHTGGPRTIQWSAVHYVTLDNENSGTVFLNPNARMIKSVIPTKNKNELPEMYWPDKKQMLVEEGDLLLFPSWLDHHTPAHTTGNLRVVVAMNVMLTYDNKEGY